MLIQGSAKSKRTEILINKYVELLDNNIEAKNILVLVQNAFKKEEFINAVRLKLKTNHFEEPQIYSFYGLAYNSILNNWPIIENTIQNGEPVILPNLTGLEISQFFFKQAIKEVGFKDYNSKINLIHQLFRRNSLIVNNNLTDKDIEKRSKILNEVFAKDAKKAIDIFKKKTIEYRAFDYIRQVNIFNYIYKNTDYFKNIEYLIVDDADEITTVEFDFIKHIKPQLKEVLVGYDRNGSTRLGFLNTDVETVNRIETFFAEEEITELDNIKEIKQPQANFSYTRRLEMIEQALLQCKELINKGVSPSEICIVTPITDTSLKFAVSEIFDSSEIKYQYFTGSDKLIDNSIIANITAILKISINDKETAPDSIEVRKIISNLLNIPIKYCLPIVENYKEKGMISFCDLQNEIYNKRLKNFVEVLQEITNNQYTLSEKIETIYNKVIQEEKDILLNENKFDTTKYMFFLKQITDFEKVFKKLTTNRYFQKAVISQLEKSIISENPSKAPEIEDNAVIISTAQKIIDFSIQKKYHIWLDTSSQEWIKDDFGTLYNAWVFQSSWTKNTFTHEDNVKLSTLKSQKILRKLSILADEIYTYSSTFDATGAENFDGIDTLLKPQNNDEKISAKINFNFTPREDQKPVLEYKDGKMAISAVPGAGKTTILLALIVKLIQNNIKSENIFVLTYMDSAARNFKERIKKICPTLDKLPNISTIHGLALRILKENSNFVKVGLDENFEVCDDLTRQRIIREIISKLSLNQDDFDKYEKAISSLKLSEAKPNDSIKDIEIKKFLKLFNTYNIYLKSKNTIDYDDMLYYCVQLLENNKDIAEYYQNLCMYIIEDEAQDSSYIQQKLINILAVKHKNVIRCGDINQAITTTFTNTDIEGFKNFIKTSNNVSMCCSQRCAKDIFTLANNLVDFAQKNKDYKNAFLDMKMQEVTGKNPQSPNALYFNVFENFKDENNFLLEETRKLFATNPQATIGLLVRNNYQVKEYTDYFSKYGFNIITRNDSLSSQPIFTLIFVIIKFCAHPWQNGNIINTAQILKKQQLLNLTQKEINFLQELKTPFILQSPDDMPSENLSKLLWDLNFWLENSNNSIENLSVKIGNYYFKSEIEKSNVYIVSMFLKMFASQYSNTDSFINKIEEIKDKPTKSKYQFFEADKNEETKETLGTIQIMTYHKSKGDEFDYVFIPSLTEELLQLDKKAVKIKSKERFIESVKAINSKYKKKDENEQKIFQIEENLRLFYVAITRAKKKLYITASNKYKKYSKIKDTKPSILFDTILKSSGAFKNVKK